MSELGHVRVEEVADGIYASIALPGRAAVGNAGVVDLGDELLVFDTHISPQAAEELRGAAERALGKPVGEVALSHWHADHIGGAGVFPEARVTSTLRTRELIATLGRERYAARRAQLEEVLGDAAQMAERGMDPEIVRTLVALEPPTPDHTFEAERFGYEGSGRRVELVTFGGGHTASDAFLLLPDDGVVFTADLVTIGIQPWMGHGDPDEWIRILDRMAELGVETVVPGHGPVGGPSAIGDVRAYVEDMLRLAAGEIDTLPDRYDEWDPDMHDANLEFLRSR